MILAVRVYVLQHWSMLIDSNEPCIPKAAVPLPIVSIFSLHLDKM